MAVLFSRVPKERSILLEPAHREMRYVGRPESASPTTGSGKSDQQEQAEIVNDALTRARFRKRGG
jgi:2-oxoglutarate dehydrogenase complex dehydrogenase (E1) component-like enzyme